VSQAVTPAEEGRDQEPSPAMLNQQNQEQTEPDASLPENATPQENDENTDVQALRDEAAAEQAAQKKAEEDLAAAQQPIAELESSAAQTPDAAAVEGTPVNLTTMQTEAVADLAEMQRRFAETEAARKKAEADLAAAQKKAADEAAAAQKKAAADLAAAQKKAADEAAAAQKKANDDLAAAQKKAADAEAARQKAEADAAAARKQAEELNAQMTSRATERPSMQGAVIQNVSMTIAESPVSAVQAAAPLPELVVSAQTPAENDDVQSTSGVLQRQSSPQSAKFYTIAAWPPDCLWEIAGRVYGDPFRWPVLYEANRSKLTDPDNPDLLEPGTVLEIPSINGETREGEYIR
jgi:nucleoid-associated protein YgaU